MAPRPSSKVIAGGNKKAPRASVAPPVTRLSVSTKDGKEKSVSVRQIDNGYVIRESTWDNKTGRCIERERYSPTAPKIDVAALGKAGK